MRKYLHNQIFPSFPITQRIFKIVFMNIRFRRMSTTDLFPYLLTLTTYLYVHSKTFYQKEVSLKYSLCWLFYCLDLNFLAGIAAERPKLTEMPDNNAGWFFAKNISIYRLSKNYCNL